MPVLNHQILSGKYQVTELTVSLERTPRSGFWAVLHVHQTGIGKEVRFDLETEAFPKIARSWSTELEPPCLP
jgi:hypothetical protein